MQENRLLRLLEKRERLGVGLMSGTSADGIDAALVRVCGAGESTRCTLLAYASYPYSQADRAAILRLFDYERVTLPFLARMDFYLGELYADAVLRLCREQGLDIAGLDFIGSHGQTVYHCPEVQGADFFDRPATVQLGEPAVIAQRTGVVTVGDFRVTDVAAGGLGAPLVPYTEYLLWQGALTERGVLLQNIGGIANVTVLPAGGGPGDVLAFDNGPGNMVIDAVVARGTQGRLRYDEDGRLAASGAVCRPLLDRLLDDPYFRRPPPKTTGREYFGAAYAQRLWQQADALGLCLPDLAATATALTACCLADSYRRFVPAQARAGEVILSGGGAYNPTLRGMLAAELPELRVSTQEEHGQNSDAKEAVAFALLANEALNAHCNTLPQVTGASRPVVMGKICL